MALIQCQECGKQMSDSASKCPNCGANRLQAVGATAFQKACAIFIILVGLFVSLGGLFSPEIKAQFGNTLWRAIGTGLVGCGWLVLFARSRKN
jgi:uncharacterized membrane protein